MKKSPKSPKSPFSLKRNGKSLAALALLAAAVPASQGIGAVNVTWDGGGDGTTWTDSVNWAGDVAPASGDSITFNSATGLATDKVISLGGAQTIANLSYYSTSLVFTLGNAGETLTLTNVSRTGYPNNTQTIAADVVLAANSGWNQAGSGLLNVTGNISGAGKSLGKIGSGELKLSGDNSYDGGTFINAGTLTMGSANALGTSGTITFGGGSLKVYDTTDLSARFSQAANQVYNIDTNNQNVAIGTALTSVGGRLVKNGSGTLTLDAANTYTGYTTVNGGTLALGADGTLGSTTAALNLAGGTFDLGGKVVSVGAVNFTGAAGGVQNGTLTGTSYYATNTGGAITVSANLAGAGIGLTKANGGMLTLTGANTYTGDTKVMGGTVKLDFNSATAPLSDIINSSSVLTMSNATLTLAGKNAASTSNSQTFANGVTFNSGASALTITNPLSSVSTVLNMGAITRNSGATVNFAQPTNNTTLSAANGYTTTTSNDASGILGGWATVGSTPTDWATNDGTNIVAYTGYTDLASTTDLTDATKNARVAAGSTWDIGQTAGTFDMNTLLVKDTAARTITVGTGNTLRFGAVGGILTPASTGALTIGASGNAGTITAGGADNTAGELIVNNATAVNVNSVIADNGTGAVALTKAGAGTLTLNATNTNTGGTTVNAGTLAMGGPGAVVVSGTSFLTGAGAMDPTMVSVANTTGLAVGQSVWGPNIPDGTTITAINGNVVTLSQRTTLTTGTTTYSLNYNSADSINRLSNTGAITVNGGTLNLGTSLQTTSGPIVINGGTLSNGKLINTGANYDLRAGTISASLGGAVGITKTTAGTVTLSNTISNTFTGTTTILEGTIAGAAPANISAINGDLVVGSPNGGNAASYTQTNVNFNARKNVTVYSNGSVNFGSNAQHLTNNVTTIIGGSVTGGQIYLDGAPIKMTGGSFGGTIYGNLPSTFTINPSDTTATVSASFQSNSETFAVADGAAAVDLSFTGGIGASGKGITKTGAGLMVISTSQGYTGSTTINGGTLRVDMSAFGAPTSNMLHSNGTGALALGGGTLEIVGKEATLSSQVLPGTVSINAGSSTISAVSGVSGTTNVVVGSAITRAAGGTLNLVTPANGSFTTTATTNIADGVLVSAASNGVAFATLNGSEWATVTAGAFTAASHDTDFTAAASNIDVTSSAAPDAFTVNTLRFNTADTTLTLTGANTVSSGGILVSSAGTNVAITEGTIQAGGGNELVVINNGQLNIGSEIAGSGKALTLAGTGATTLSGNNSYTGATNVYGGTLIVTGSLAANSATTIKDGAVLAGTGRLGNVTVSAGVAGISAGGAVDPGAGVASVANNGTVTPNNAIGKLTVGSFNLATGTHLAMQASGATDGAADQIATSGAVTLGGDAQISLILGYTPQAGDALYLILNGSSTATTGAFSNINGQVATEGSTITVNGYQWTLSYLGNGDSQVLGNDVMLTAMAVPEPATWAFMVGGLGMLAFLKRTRRNRA